MQAKKVKAQIRPARQIAGSDAYELDRSTRCAGKTNGFV
jgi:hypothetical protein